MSSLQQRITIDMRLEIITDTAANLKAQLRELIGLRDRVRKAQQSARRSEAASRRDRAE